MCGFARLPGLSLAVALAIINVVIEEILYHDD